MLVPSYEYSKIFSKYNRYFKKFICLIEYNVLCCSGYLDYQNRFYFGIIFLITKHI